MAATSQSLRSQFPRNKNANYGVQKEPIPGISLTSSLMSASLDSDRRYHKTTWQCTAVNFTGGTGKVPTVLTGVGVVGTLTLDLAVSAFNVPGAVTVHSGTETGFVTGDTVSVPDATGGAIIIGITAATGKVTAATVLSYGPSAIDPRLIIGNVYVIVGTTAVLETTATMEIFRALFNFQPISYGQLPIFFTEPWRNNTDGRATSWDMAGQGVFTFKFQMLPGWQQINITGTMIFDYIRNTAAGEIDQITYQGYIATGNFPAPRLQIIARKLLTPTLNGGDTIIAPNLIPTGWPILRMHFFPGTPGIISKLLMKADTQIQEQGQIGVSNAGATMDQLREELIERGFNLTLTNVAPSVAPDYSFVADYDQRIQNRLKVSNLGLTITSSIASPLTILQEYLETSYS